MVAETDHPQGGSSGVSIDHPAMAAGLIEFSAALPIHEEKSGHALTQGLPRPG